MPSQDGPVGSVGLLRAGALLAGTGVALGAFGAHLLEDRITSEAMATYDTAVIYHLIHGVAVFAIGLAVRGGQPRLARPGWVLTFGSVLFASVLYGLALGGPSMLGAVAPIGGAAMIGGWLWLAVRTVE
jgi:uncharacterized membrane protein YgdD (TMEM256/DUF423 family)